MLEISVLDEGISVKSTHLSDELEQVKSEVMSNINTAICHYKFIANQKGEDKKEIWEEIMECIVDIPLSKFTDNMIEK